MTDRVVEASSVDTPWMRQKDWAHGRIRSIGVAQIVMFWVMTTLWNGFAWTWMILIWGDPEEEDVVKVLSLFCLIGLGIFVWTVRRTWAWLRFGGSVLELASTPGVIGGTLEGQIQTGIQTFPTKPIQLTLTCIRKQPRQKIQTRNRHHARHPMADGSQCGSGPVHPWSARSCDSSAHRYPLRTPWQ